MADHKEHRTALKQAKSTFGEKMKKLKGEGKPHKQALAITLSMQRRGELKRK